MTTEKRLELLERAFINATLDNTKLKLDLEEKTKEASRNWKWFSDKNNEFEEFKEDFKDEIDSIKNDNKNK